MKLTACVFPEMGVTTKPQEESKQSFLCRYVTFVFQFCLFVLKICFISHAGNSEYVKTKFK